MRISQRCFPQLLFCSVPLRLRCASATGAFVDMDGTLTVTTGECKEGMDISYKGDWGYRPLVVSLANTSEVL